MDENDNFNVIMRKINSFYKKPISERDVFLENHSKIIKALLWFWVDKEMQSPLNGQRVLAIQDLRFVGKGAFVSEFYYENGGFVANKGDTDPYGHITFWVAEDTINNLSLLDLNKICYR